MIVKSRAIAFRFCVISLAVAGAGAAQAASMRVPAGRLYDDVSTVQGMEFLAGGVGIDAQQRLNRHAKDNDYNMKLVFALNPGNYVADVDVVLKDERGNTLVRQLVDGPLFMAKVPKGAYTIEATYKDKTHVRKLHVGRHGLTTSHFYWPADPATDFTLARPHAPARTAMSRER